MVIGGGDPEYKRLFNNKPGIIPTLGIRLQPHLEDIEVELDAISVVRSPKCPPWLFQQPSILFNLSDLRKGDGGGMGVTSAWSPLGNFIEGQAHPNVLLILCFSHVITYGSRIFCITFQSI